MDFALTADQEQVRDAVRRTCSAFDDAYWQDREPGAVGGVEERSGGHLVGMVGDLRQVVLPREGGQERSCREHGDCRKNESAGCQRHGS